MLTINWEFMENMAKIKVVRMKTVLRRRVVINVNGCEFVK